MRLLALPSALAGITDLLLQGAAHALAGRRTDVSKAAAAFLRRHREVGVASWYDPGRRTFRGVTYDSSDLTAAHRSLPFGTPVTSIHCPS